MKWLVYIILFCMGSWVYGQEQAWELKQEELDTMIQQADIIFEGELPKNIDSSTLYDIKVLDPIMGPQRFSKLTMPGTILGNLTIQRAYIFFVKRNESNQYTFLAQHNGTIKSDIFIKSRIRKEVMKWRLKSADAVAVGTVQALEETPAPNNALLIRAKCETLVSFQGTLPKVFPLEYQRPVQMTPKPVMLLPGLTYIFFLKKVPNKEIFTTVDPYYEGIFHESRYFIDEIKAASHIANQFEIAGQPADGIQVFAVPAKESFTLQEPVLLNGVIQNVGQKNIEIYHNQILSFTKISIINEQKNELMPMKNNQPGSSPKIEKRHFLTLTPQGYAAFPPMDLRQYTEFTPGKYIVFIEINLSEEYGGKTIGKNGWIGRVMSNRIDIEIK